MKALTFTILLLSIQFSFAQTDSVIELQIKYLEENLQVQKKLTAEQYRSKLFRSSVDEIQYNIDKEVSGNCGIVVEQDFFVDWWPDKNFDRNYSQGTMFFYSKPTMRKSPLFVPLNAVEWLAKKLGGETGSGERINISSTLKFGVTAFTPLVIDSVIPVVGDRPFANLVFLSTEKGWYNINTGVFTLHSFNYGWIGSNVANTFQSFAHEYVVPGRPTEISWNHQISRGGNFAFMYSLSSTKTIIDVETSESNKKKWFDAGLGYKINLGWYTGIETSLSFRLGSISKGNIAGINGASNMYPYNKGNIVAKNTQQTYEDLKSELDYFKEHHLDGNDKKVEYMDLDNLKANYQSAVLEYSNFPQGPEAKKGGKKVFDWYFFGSAAPRLTPYNSLILGQPSKGSIYTLPYEDYNPFLLDLQYGVVVSWLRTKDYVFIPVKRWDVLLSINHRSPEIRPDNEFKRWHHWGKVAIDFALF